MCDNMNGKKIKVAELELKFGNKVRYVNVFSVFRYKPSNILYVIYADVNRNESYVSYGTSHVKGSTILSMTSNNKQDDDIISTYISEVVGEKKLSNYEIISLDEVEEIEIISSKNLKVDKDTYDKLIKMTIPVDKVEVDDNKDKVSKKKKSPILTLLIILLLLIIVGGGYFVVPGFFNKEPDTFKSIVCTKSYESKDLSNVNIVEEKNYFFDSSDKLRKLDVFITYNFLNEDSYYDFVNKSLYYNYRPDETEDTKGGYKLDDDSKVFSTYASTIVDDSYLDPVDYEEIISANGKENYKCEEKIDN